MIPTDSTYDICNHSAQSVLFQPAFNSAEFFDSSDFRTFHRIERIPRLHLLEWNKSMVSLWRGFQRVRRARARWN